MFTTLIGTSDLAARLDDPSVAIVDVRHDLAQPDDWGMSQFRLGHIPGARFPRMSTATCLRPRPAATDATLS